MDFNLANSGRPMHLSSAWPPFLFWTLIQLGLGLSTTSAQTVERYSALPINLDVEHLLSTKLDERTNIKDIRNYRGMMYVVTKDRGVYRTRYKNKDRLESIKFPVLKDKELNYTFELDDELWVIADNRMMHCISGTERVKNFGSKFDEKSVLMDVCRFKDKFVSAMLEEGLKFRSRQAEVKIEVDRFSLKIDNKTFKRFS